MGVVLLGVVGSVSLVLLVGCGCSCTTVTVGGASVIFVVSTIFHSLEDLFSSDAGGDEVGGGVVGGGGGVNTSLRSIGLFTASSLLTGSCCLTDSSRSIDSASSLMPMSICVISISSVSFSSCLCSLTAGGVGSLWPLVSEIPSVSSVSSVLSLCGLTSTVCAGSLVF